jgi:hypothetical protein
MVSMIPAIRSMSAKIIVIIGRLFNQQKIEAECNER